MKSVFVAIVGKGNLIIKKDMAKKNMSNSQRNSLKQKIKQSNLAKCSVEAPVLGRKKTNPTEIDNATSRLENGSVLDVDKKISTHEDDSAVCQTKVFERLPHYGDNNTLTAAERKELLVKIADDWHQMDDLNDFCRILNLAFQILYGKNAKATSVKRLISLARKGRYFSFKIPKKKKGEFRSIDAPGKGLRNVQRALNLVLQEIYTPHAAAMGFVIGRSVVSNAQVHLGQNYVYNIDLKDFFPSITSGRVFKRLQAKPFCLNEKIASMVSDLCCYKHGDLKVLPQGAPTSPTITNIICERLDIKLSRLAKAYGLKYTRYADDISFSGMTNLFAEDKGFCNSLRNIIEQEEHFTINNEKTRLCHRGMRQEVTGLTVNNKTNVSRKYVKQLRTLIHNWEVKGYEEAQTIFAEHYAETNTRNLKFKGEHHIENIISGKLMYLKMVKGETDSTYKKLWTRFDKLIPVKYGGGKNVPTFSEEKVNGDILNELTTLVNLIEMDTPV